jgi:ABC-type nitrate/sulfonate/bicarbonate transport system ATPase subunit
LADRIVLLSPSPARMLSDMRIECPRVSRSPEQIAAVRREIAQKFHIVDG